MTRLGFFVAALCAALVVLGATGAGAATRATVVNITNDGPADNGDNEVDIAINPTNTSNLIAAWNDYARTTLKFPAEDGFKIFAP